MQDERNRTFEPERNRSHRPRIAGARAGFSLLEILVVVLIITILATIVGVNVAQKPGEAKVAKAMADLSVLKTGLQLYRLQQGRFPEQGQGLRALVEKPTQPPVPETYPEEGYLDTRRLPTDPWGNPYVYLIPGTEGSSFEIISYGADGEPGGEGVDADLTTLDL